MTILQRTLWTWNSPRYEGTRILTGLIFWSAILIGILWLAINLI